MLVGRAGGAVIVVTGATGGGGVGDAVEGMEDAGGGATRGRGVGETTGTIRLSLSEEPGVGSAHSAG